jgi:protein-S-isoprenylcysteine O-methyltransferase Ste14
MRNPIRLKNLKLRFGWLYLLGAVTLYSFRPEPVNLLAGGSLVALGSVLRTWGAGHLVKNDRLTVTGPYAHLRHPLYAGTLLVGSGFAVIAGGALSVFLLALLMPWFFLMYFPRKERIESARLEALYGAQFAGYREAVPALIPLLRAWRPATGQGEAFDDLARTWTRDRYLDNNELGTLIALIAGLVLFVLRAQFGG